MNKESAKSNKDCNITFTYFKKVNDKYAFLIAFLVGLVIITIGTYLYLGPFVIITDALKGANFEEIYNNFYNNLINYQGYLTLINEIVGIGIFLVFFRFIFKEDLISFKKNYKKCLLSIVLGILAVYGSGELFEYLQNAFNITSSSNNQELLLNSLKGPGKYALIISIVIIGPLFEELLFRKLLYGYLSRTKLHIVLNVIIMVLAFALIHCTSENFLTFKAYFFLLNYIVLSMCLCIPYVVSSGNIYVSLLIHIFNNLISLLSFYGVLYVLF